MRKPRMFKSTSKNTPNKSNKSRNLQQKLIYRKEHLNMLSTIESYPPPKKKITRKSDMYEYISMYAYIQIDIYTYVYIHI